MANYRYDLDNSEYVKLGYIRNFQNTDIMVLPQIADYATPFGLKLANDRIWIVAPSVDKPIKVVIEGATLSYTDGVYANANLTQSANLQKSWATGVATGAVAAVLELP